MQNLAQMPLADDHDVIKAFSSDRADQPFAMSILPRRAWSGRFVANSHSAQTSFGYVAIDAVPVANEAAPCHGESEGAGPSNCQRQCNVVDLIPGAAGLT